MLAFNQSSPSPLRPEPPRMSTATTWDPVLAATRIRALQHLPRALPPILHALQDEFGYTDESSVPVIAEVLNLSQAEVHGVITFYHHFRHLPPGRHTLEACRAESCQSMGCEKLVAHLEQRLGVKIGNTTANDSITLRAVYCLGNCALSPAAMLDGKPYGRLSPEIADFLIDDLKRRDEDNN